MNGPEFPTLGDDLEDEGEREITDRDLQGDIAELGENRYREWKWYVYRLRTPVERAEDPAAGLRELMTVFVGPVDIMQVQRDFGGGQFEFRGFQDRMRKLKRVALAGPRKVFSQSVVMSGPAPAAAPAADGILGELAVSVRQQGQLLERLAERVSNPAPAPAQGMTFDNVIQLATLISGQREHQQTTPEVFKEMAGLFRQGLEAGASRDPGETNTTAAVIQTLAPSIERIASALLTRRGGAPTPAARPAMTTAAPVSSAHVIETHTNTAAAPAAPDQAETETSFRMQAVTDSLARAISAFGTQAERDPEDFAGTIEDLLEPSEIAILRLATLDGLMSELETVSERYPVFRSPQARAYCARVLAALRGDTDAA